MNERNVLRLLALLALIFTCLIVATTISRAEVPVRKACPAGHVQKCRSEIVRLRAAVKWHRQRAVTRAWPGDGAAAIILACNAQHVSMRLCDEARRVAACESHTNPLAKNRTSTASGLFQFLDSTWARAGVPGLSVFDAYANAYSAVRMASAHGWHEWVCQP